MKSPSAGRRNFALPTKERVDFPDDMTLADARDALRELVVDGHDCPCCGRLAQIRPRTIHSAMAHDLLAAYRQSGKNWFFLPDLVGDRGTGDVTKCRYWGLLEQQPGEREDGSKRTGWWRVTSEGEAWIFARTTVPKYAHIYNKRCLRHSGELIAIGDALGEKFDYRKLIDGLAWPDDKQPALFDPPEASTHDKIMES